MKQKIILLAALLLVPLSHADAKAKVFILSGQSNMREAMIKALK